MTAHMTRSSVKVSVVSASFISLALGSRLCPLHDAARRLEPYPAHIRSPLRVAAPTSRVRRVRAQESETSLSGGVECQRTFRFASWVHGADRAPGLDGKFCVRRSSSPLPRLR